MSEIFSENKTSFDYDGMRQSTTNRLKFTVKVLTLHLSHTRLDLGTKLPNSRGTG